MKKRFFSPLVMIIIVISMIYSCDPKPSTNPNTICSDYSGDPISELPIGLIIDMVDGYEDNQYAVINRGLNMEDAKAISFDLETLKKFIYHIESITKKNDSSISSEKLGIRIYYASYPRLETWKNARYQNALDLFIGDSITEQYEKKHTLLMVPTIERGNIAYDFNPKDVRTYNTPLQRIIFGQKGGVDDSDPEAVLMGLSLMSQQKSGSNNPVAQNHGGLFPPKTGTGLGF